jgi:hypothetical protein
VNVLFPTPEAYRALWDLIPKQPGVWSLLEGQSWESFEKTMLSSSLIVCFEEGFIRITDFYPEHCCRIHPVFWSKDIVRNLAKRMDEFLRLAGAIGLVRVECIIPTQLHGLNRLATRAGFHCEGMMKKWYKTKEGFMDAYLWAILKEEGV